MLVVVRTLVINVPFVPLRSRVRKLGHNISKNKKGVPNYWPTCVRYSVFFYIGRRVRLVRCLRNAVVHRGFASGVSAAHTSRMFCERAISANTILRLSKMSVHAEFPGESQFY